MENRRTRQVMLGALLVGLVFAWVGGAARAQEDLALRIYKLARALHDDNLAHQNFTFWVNGHIGAGAIPQGITALEMGKPLPDFTFSAFESGQSITKRDLEPPYMLNFWASWCGPCREEFPLLDAAIADGRLAMPVLFINVYDNQFEALNFTRPYRERLRLYLDGANAFARKHGINAIPQTILVDAEGNIQALHLGNMTEVAIAFFAEIAAHPGVGAFDSANPDIMPSPTPEIFYF